MILELPRHDTALLLIDWQERLCAAMPQAIVERNTRNVENLLTLAARLSLPVIATEQYPKGLGPTVAPLRDHLLAAPHAKTSFSALRDDAAAAALRATGRRVVLVAGMETHICVFQTVRDLVAAGYGVQVPADAVLSRTKANYRNGLDLLRAAGALITNAEAALFDLLGVGAREAFKEVSRLIR